ncbi:MAG: hypothetical protein FGF48_10110 [Candidatus Brockarchaeota archaeon]|nr:hypothetical protein [Candidatus Brockarchaeota archaeon]
MQEKKVLIAMLLIAVGSALFMSGFETEEKQARLRVTAGNVLYNATLNVERFGYWAKEIMLNASTTLLISADVTGLDGNEQIHCIDFYVLNNASYFTWLQKHVEHKERASWFKWEEGLKYICETVDKTGNYVLKINRTNNYYFILDNSGRCAKKVFFRILDVEEVETESSSENQPPTWVSLSGIILLALGFTLLLYGFLTGRRSKLT